MHVYECAVADRDVASLFEIAVYRFLELHPMPAHSSVSIYTAVRASGFIKSLRLWNAHAVADFDRHWRSFQQERRPRRPFKPEEACVPHRT